MKNGNLTANKKREEVGLFRLICEQQQDLQYFQEEAERIFTYFCECQQGAGLILGVFSAR